MSFILATAIDTAKWALSHTSISTKPKSLKYSYFYPGVLFLGIYSKKMIRNAECVYICIFIYVIIKISPYSFIYNKEN